jgi:RNA polymerase sigma-70 factor (ECF subfamily)
MPQPAPEPEPPIPFPGTGRVPAGGATTDLDPAVDARLLAELAAGHSGALAELYRRRAGALLRLLERILGDVREAEEVLQDTFVQLWKRAGRYDAAKAGPLTWMILVTRGLALDRLRQRSRRQTGLERFRAASDADGVQEENAFTWLSDAESARRVGQALGSLPAEQRTAIELAFYRGCTQEEIARTTGQPLGTIKARIRRGMLALRQRLKERHD